MKFSPSSKFLWTIAEFVSGCKTMGSVSPGCADGSSLAGTEKMVPMGIGAFPPQIAIVYTPSGYIAILYWKFCWTSESGKIIGSSVDKGEVLVSNVYTSEMSGLNFWLQPICILPESKVKVIIAVVILSELSSVKLR